MPGQEAYPNDPVAGARNLLEGCVGLAAGERLLLVVEDSAHGYYAAAAPACVGEVAAGLGAAVETYRAPLIGGPDDLPADLAQRIGAADHVVFFARIGDQLRFTALPGKADKTMCYALDGGVLGSALCRMPQGLMTAVLARLEQAIAAASRWRMTCPLGTMIEGSVENFHASAEGEAGGGEQGGAGGFSLKLFPEMIFRPLPCRSASGRVAVARWVMATANRVYEPARLDLDRPVFARVDGGRIAGFEGPGATVAALEAHYRHVGALFGIDPWVVHSWHAGIHPKTTYPRPAGENLERWGGLAFASPRYAHFHTCGDYPPGEIAWSLFDVTASFDGETFWRDGRLVFLDRPEIQALLADYPDWNEGFAEERAIGID